MRKMKIGLIKETKIPVDNRVAVTPRQVAELNKRFPQHKIVVQSSNIRAFSDEDYRLAGVDVVGDVSDCDILFGIKEVQIEELIPNKHYFFFGHLAKMQEYNRPLLKALVKKNITFSDYEYLVDDNNVRVCAFGWWAGIVGVYYTLRGYGLKYELYELPQPDRKFSLTQLIETLKSVALPKMKMLVTGAGRVSQGAQYVLEKIGAERIDESAFLSDGMISTLTYCVADVDQLVKRKDGTPFCWQDFTKNAIAYESDFFKFAQYTDVLLCAHFWGNGAPVYLDVNELKNEKLRIRMIGDVTCDIMGSIKSTVRSSTHEDPYYDYNPITGKEEKAFAAEKNITVMAVDTCPNALAMDTSEYFGEMLMKYVLEPLLLGEESAVIKRSTILQEGKLTPHFAYLKDFAEKNI